MLKDILALSQRKNNLLRKMVDITSERVKLNEAEQAGKILELIEVRQGNMEEIDALDREIGQLTGKLENLSGGERLYGNRTEHLAGLWKEIGEQRKAGLRLVREIQELDARQRPKLEMQLSRFKQLQEEIKLGRKTLGAYRQGSARTESVFVDEKK